MNGAVPRSHFTHLEFDKVDFLSGSHPYLRGLDSPIGLSATRVLNQQGTRLNADQA